MAYKIIKIEFLIAFTKLKLAMLNCYIYIAENINKLKNKCLKLKKQYESYVQNIDNKKQ